MTFHINAEPLSTFFCIKKEVSLKGKCIKIGFENGKICIFFGFGTEIDRFDFRNKRADNAESAPQ